LRRDGASTPQRLAFYTLPPPPDDADRPSHLSHSPPELIDCEFPIESSALDTARDALYRYETYRPVIEEHRPLESVGDHLSYELFGETHDPPLSSLNENLPDESAGPAHPSVP
ncbi:MAG: PIG-L family deacetylase, partial [Salinibacter sp.]